MKELIFRSIGEHAEALSKREYSSEELTREILDLIDRHSKTNAYITVCAERALCDAQKADAIFARGEEHSPLLGVPYALKDNICAKGIRTTAASKMLENYIPPYDATVASRLSASGAVLLGKTNLDEFGMGSSTEKSIYGATENPIATNRTAGGSSGGSAAAVASGQAIFALGSDTGGSVRMPASFCGLVGLCPTYGRVSRYGLIAYASSLDRIGVIARSSKDAAVVLSAISGADGFDAKCACSSFSSLAPDLEAKSLRIGIAKELMSDGISDGTRSAVLSVVAMLCECGAKCAEASLPGIKNALAAYYIISSAEASSNLARYDGVRYGYRFDNAKDMYGLFSSSRSHGFGEEVKRRIMLGTFALSSGYYDEYYKKADAVRHELIAEFERNFEKYDIIIAPSTPNTAFELGRDWHSPTEIYGNDICTVPSSLAGLPAISIPFGEDENGLPFGVQLIAPCFSEDKLCFIAELIEKLSEVKK